MFKGLEMYTSYSPLVPDTALQELANQIADSCKGAPRKAPRVSVIIPCFNATGHIRPCLEAMIHQTLPYEDFEVICVDDCSTDDTVALIESYKARLPNLRLLKHEVNRKQGAARNTGLDAARGDYITFVDDDDFLRLDALEILLDLASGADLAAGQLTLIRYDQPFPKKVTKRYFGPTKREGVLDGSFGWWPVAMLISRKVIEENRIRFREGVYFEDIDFVTRVFFAIRTRRIFKEAIYYYVQRDGSTVMSTSETKLEHSANAVATMLAFLKEATEEERKAYIKAARQWLTLQAQRISESPVDQPRKQALARHLIAHLRKHWLFQHLGQDLVRQIEKKAEENPRARAPRKILDNYGFEYQPWAKRFAGRYDGKVVFYCEVNYHIRSAAPIARALRARGVESVIVDASRSTSFTTNRPLTDEEEAQFTDLDIFKVNVAEGLPFATDAAAFVFMNDLTYTKALLYENFGFGVPTFGFYEGINDDWNIDRKSPRRPYRTTDYLLLPGLYQTGFYQDRTCMITGLPNVRSRLAEPATAPKERIAVINVNFTYGVLEDRRDTYVKTAVKACEELGLKYVITQHPADKADLSQYNVGTESVYDLLEQGALLISRFSTTILEALAMGRPVVYHNPIGEGVPKFGEPLDAFSKSHDVESLKQAISHELERATSPQAVRDRAALFLHFHCNTAAEDDPDTLAAAAIESVVKNPQPRFDFKRTAAPKPSALPLPETLDIAFFPLRGYHLNDCLPVVETLRRKGRKVAIVETDGWRDSQDTVADAAAELDIPLLSMEDFVAKAHSLRSVVMWNDWDLLMRRVSKTCHNLGVETISWVEGIQDYLDVDRGPGLMRAPYRRSKHVILPGAFDKRYFEATGQVLHEGEVVRVGALWQTRRESPLKGSPRPKALINSNFSYGVLEDKRDTWLTQAVEACRSAGYEPVISRHPYDTGTLFAELVTEEDFWTAAQACDVTIQRFASGILEALAMGIPVIYFNPHGEKVDKFKDPAGAYKCAESGKVLNELLSARTYGWDEASARAFLKQHCNLSETDTAPGARITEILEGILSQADAIEIGKHLHDLPARGEFLALRNSVLTLRPFYGEGSTAKTSAPISGNGTDPALKQAHARLREQFDILRREASEQFQMVGRLQKALAESENQRHQLATEITALKSKGQKRG